MLPGSRDRIGFCKPMLLHGYGHLTVLNALNDFLRKQVLLVQQPAAVSQADLKMLYAACVLEMRKDAGFSQTEVPADHYQFVSFFQREG